VFLHLEIGNAVAHEAADAVVFLEQRHVVTRARKLLRTCHARGPGAHHGDFLPGPGVRRLRPHPTLVPALVDDRLLDRLDRHRVVVDVQRARRFARRGADAAGELGEIVGRMQDFERVAPVVAIDEVVPVRDHVVDRATSLAERYAAVHAARALSAHLRFGQRPHELLVELHALGDRRVRPVVTLDFHEAGDFSHVYFLPLPRAPRQ